MSKLITRGAGILVALAAVTTAATAGPANAVTSGDPLATGCANGAQTIWSSNYLGVGTVEVRYSPSCGTNWVRVTGATNRASEAGITSPASGWQWSPSYGRSPSSYWTPMVYAPGSTCIQFRVKIQKLDGLSVWDTGYKTLC
ncbi:DUF2690 domain-containing protein [Tsukamurella hominis]|uniref:DUF2690 domain-containing protein n=1 Tax=Tsukamurella hominis TaxID=1970232 RepID=UPI0039ECA1DD